MPVLDVPGVYIDEVTGAGTIAGVSTSTAAFVGPALAGPINEPRRITSYDEFLQLYGLQQPDGTYFPFMTVPRVFFLAHGVKGFYDNGGRQAYIVRVGTALAAAWDIRNAANQIAFRLRAVLDGISGNNITVDVQAANFTGAAGVSLATASATVGSVNGVVVNVNDASPFRVGDTVTRQAAPEIFTNRATITQIQGNSITLSNALAGLAAADTLRLASIIPEQNTFRVAATTGLAPGTIANLSGDDADNTGNNVQEPVVIQTVNQAGFVTVAPSPSRTRRYNLASGVTAPVLISQEFRLVITPSGGTAETFDNLSLSPTHPNYVFAAVASPLVTVVAPQTPPLAAVPQNLIPAAANVARAVNGVNDDPGAITSAEFQEGLDALRDIEDANLIVVPDAAAHPEAAVIQPAVINHCLTKRDRFAVLDSRPGAPTTGPGSVLEQRGGVQAFNGFAALYYPWIAVKDPTTTGPIVRLLHVPPSGAMAGVYARIDNERGVHKPPANTDVRGVLGLERILSDAQHGPLNLEGIDVLRIFPGTAQVIVWGARTTGDPAISDWIYVNVRRLMIYIEQSIEEGIRWAVFEPNGLPLWQKLKRTLNEFLTRVWRSGALFGATADKAFYVRIDEALNPPATRARGELYIEIGVAPVRPAEFIVVRIGLWDGGAQISES
jgi:phage tail sheath protein FI